MSRKITIVNDDLDLPIKDEASVLELLLKHEINIDHSCGGMGSCGTCRVLVKSDLKVLPERNDIELERAEDLQFESDERLACQLCPSNNLKIEIP